MTLKPNITDKKIILFVCFILFSSNIDAQIKEETATTTRVYEPDVKKIEKKEETAKMPSVQATDKISINYQLTDVQPISTFETSLLPPSKLNNLPKNTLYKNYIKAGYGNLAHLLLDGYFMYSLDKSNDIGIRLFHNSYSKIAKYPYNTSTAYGKTQAEVFYQALMKTGKLHADINFENQRYNLFGTSFPQIYFNDSTQLDLKQKLNSIGGKMAYQAFNNKYFRGASLDAHYLKDHFQSKELDVKFLAFLDFSGYEATIFNEDFEFGADAKIFTSVTNAKFKDTAQHSFKFFHPGITPVVKLENDKFRIQAGASIEYLSDNDKSGFHFFPSAEVKYQFTDELEFLAGIDGGLHLNTYQALTEENLYLYPDQALKTTKNKYGIYGGVNGFIGSHFGYSVQAKYTKADNILYYVKQGDTIAQAGKAYQLFNTFSAAYDDGSILGFSGQLKYLKIQNLNLALQLNYDAYSLKNNSNILNRPNLQATITAGYKMLEDKLALGADVYFVGARTTNEYELSNTPNIPPLVHSTIKNLPSFVDFNLNAEYYIKPNITVFLKTFNLLNAKYQYYSAYQAYGSQFMGGIFFKF